MSALNIPNTFTSGDVAVAADVNANFDAIEGWSTAVIQESGAVFTDFPTLPAGSGGANSATNKTYVDDRFKANTGTHVISVSPAAIQLAPGPGYLTVAQLGTTIPIPTNATNSTLTMVASGDIELVGIVPGSLVGSFAMRIEFCWDTGAAVPVWDASNQTSGFTQSVANIPYGGMSVTACAIKAPYSVAANIGARLTVVHRDFSYPTNQNVHMGTPHLTLQIARQIPFA